MYLLEQDEEEHGGVSFSREPNMHKHADLACGQLTDPARPCIVALVQETTVGIQHYAVPNSVPFR